MAKPRAVHGAPADTGRPARTSPAPLRAGTVARLALALFAKYNAAPVENGFKFVEKHAWVSISALKLDIGWHLGVDGINLGLLVMGAIVAFAAACVSREITRLEKEYYTLLLVMTGGILGAFASLNLFFFYFFHELALVPTFIMIGVWGHGENRNYATFKITIYLSLGALIALAGLIALYIQSGANTFDIVELTKAVKARPLPLAAQSLIFPLLLFGFGEQTSQIILGDKEWCLGVLPEHVEHLGLIGGKRCWLL